MILDRRSFLAGAASFAAYAATVRAQAASCPFRLAVITDEISTDFDHACYVASHDFGLHWVEVRGSLGAPDKITDAQIGDARKILAKYSLKVTDIGSPLFKSDFPGAPLSKDSPNKDPNKIPADLSKQQAMMERLVDVAKMFDADRIRCFDFWRLEDPAPFRKAMNAELDKAATFYAKHDLKLVLENEMACNTGSGKEAAATLAAVPNPNLMLNWDPGNSGSFPGDVPFPTDYAMLPKKRIGHVHVKSVRQKPGGARGFEWQPVGQGDIDWVGQLKALKADGYRAGVSLETHWHGAPATDTMTVGEASTRISMAGLKECLTKAGISC